jgi:hypothetical protein
MKRQIPKRNIFTQPIDSYYEKKKEFDMNEKDEICSLFLNIDDLEIEEENLMESTFDSMDADSPVGSLNQIKPIMYQNNAENFSPILHRMQIKFQTFLIVIPFQKEISKIRSDTIRRMQMANKEKIYRFKEHMKKSLLIRRYDLHKSPQDMDFLQFMANNNSLMNSLQ